MKIIAINRELSDKTAIALATEPPLTPELLAEFGRRIHATAWQSLPFELVSGCLRIQPKTFSPNSL